MMPDMAQDVADWTGGQFFGNWFPESGFWNRNGGTPGKEVVKNMSSYYGDLRGGGLLG